ncbi:MAG: FHA domain-containing protein, partial [Anaerolineae bacterium]|nr:FHA domain-containing protein [Anaerolineae bacterium]
YISDATTGLNVGNPVSFEPDATINLSGAGLQGQKQYGVYIIARGAGGENLFRSNTQAFVYTPFVTPTPTPTATPTATPTEEPVVVGIGSISLDNEATAFEFEILTGDQARIQSFELQLLNSETGLEIGKYIQTPPLADRIRVPISDMVGGKYTAILRAYGPNGVMVAESGQLNFAYTPQPTPTSTFTPTITPTPIPTVTPTPTPEPGIVDQVTDTVRDNPALLLVVGLIGMGLLLILLLLFRPRRQQPASADFSLAPPGGYPVVQPGMSGAPDRGMYDEATNLVAMDPEKTDVYPGMLPPLATLQFVQYPDPTRIDQAEPITEFPYTIGRGRSVDNHLSLDEDTSVSRRHATITYENSRFYVIDKGSSNGTALDGSRIMPDTPTPLHDGARIILGKNTVVMFNITSLNFSDSERTLPGSMHDDDHPAGR